MPRSRVTSGKLQAEVIANGLVASAREIKLDSGNAFRKVKRQEWQEQAWYWYDTIGEFHYATQWVGNTLSRAKLTVLKDGEPTDEPLAVEALENFFGGPDQHGEFLRQAGIHMTVTGEFYIVGQEIDGDDDWQVSAATEVKVNGSTIRVDGEEVDPASTLLIRLWRPHPRKRSMSDAPTRPVLNILSQIDELTKYVSAQVDSRLSGAGLLALPLETSFTTPENGADGKSQQAGLKAFMQEVAETMAAAKRDRSDSSARVPVMIQAPAEFLDKIKHLTFWTELDAAAEALRTEAIRRFALGMDMPPEAVLGTADMNHWGSWQVEESLIKAHSEPLLKLVTSALTEGYLRVVLEGEVPDEDLGRYSIGADTSEMRLRPNRSKEAIELWDRGALSAAAMRRENGFDEADEMKEEERKDWIITKLAQGSPSPELVQEAVRLLGIDIEVPTDETTSGGGTRGERPLPRSLEDHPTREIPSTQDAEEAALLSSAEAAVFRALERAGNRIKSTASETPIPREVKAVEAYQYVTLTKAQLDHALSDAWGHLSLLTIPDRVDLTSLEAHLDNYARMLISSRKPYDRSLLATYLALVGREA